MGASNFTPVAIVETPGGPFSFVVRDDVVALVEGLIREMRIPVVGRPLPASEGLDRRYRFGHAGRWFFEVIGQCESISYHGHACSPRRLLETFFMRHDPKEVESFFILSGSVEQLVKRHGKRTDAAGNRTR